MINLVSESQLTSDQRDLCDTIRSCVDSLLALINSILDLSKLEAGAVKLEAIPMSVILVVDEVMEMVAPMAHKKNLRILADIHPSVPSTVLGDSLRLRQILINLMTNSLKFTQTGFITVQVKMIGMVSGTEARLQFSVIDTGCGISALNQQKLFKDFGQAEDSTSRVYGGTGLGDASFHVRTSQVLNHTNRAINRATAHNAHER